MDFFSQYFNFIVSICTIIITFIAAVFTIYSAYCLPKKNHNKALKQIQIEIFHCNKKLKIIKEKYLPRKFFKNTLLKILGGYSLINETNFLNISTHIKSLIWNRKNNRIVEKMIGYEYGFKSIISLLQIEAISDEEISGLIDSTIDTGKEIEQYITKNIKLKQKQTFSI